MSIKSIARNKYIRNFFVYLSSGTLAKAIPFIVLPVIALKLSPEDFGRISNFGVLVQLFLPIIALKQDAYLQAQFFRIDNTVRRNIVSGIVAISFLSYILTTILAFFFGYLIEEYLGLPKKWAFMASTVALGTSLFSLRSVVLRLQEKSKIFAKFQIAFTVLNAGLTLFFIYGLDMSWEGRVISSFSSALLFIIITLIYLNREGLLKVRIDKSEITSTMKFSLPLVPQAVTPLLRNTTDKVLITNYISIAVNGVYSLSLNFASAFDTLTSMFYSTYLPRLYKMLTTIEESNDLNTKNQLKKEAYFTFVGIAGVLFIGYFALVLLIKLAFSSEYEDALKYLPFLLVHVLLKAIYYYFTQIVLFTKKTNRFGLLVFIVGVTHVSISFLLIQSYGVVGIIAGMLIADVVRVIITFSISNKYMPLQWSKF